MYLVTHSLLSSWLYALKDNPWSDKDPMEDFMQVLNRQPTETTEAMRNGIDFENLVTDILNGERAEDLESPWYEAASSVADRCRGGILQLRASKKIRINGYPILLYGRLDCLKAGEIIDIKFSKSYERGKYFDSTQHPTYLRLIPEAEKFSYIISNGSSVWTETYSREETQDISPVISDFITWLKTMGLFEIFQEKWRSK